MQSRKPKFQGIKTKWEIKREKRPAKREKRGKKPLAEPLTIAPALERNAAAKNGKMVFYDGGKRVEVPLIEKHTLFGKSLPGTLQGVYKRANGQIILFRAFSSKQERKALIGFLARNKLGGESFITNNFNEITFALRNVDLGHVLVHGIMRGESFALKAVSKTEREQRAKARGKHSFYEKRFTRLFQRLHYSQVDRSLISKGRAKKFNPKDNLGKWHRIEAIDPKNGKARLFTFPIRVRKK